MDRTKFHFPANHYFLSHSVGAQPKGFDAALAAGFAEPWRKDGAAVWDTWFKTLDLFRHGLAPLIGSDPQDICPQSNVSSGLSKILLSLPERARRTKIVLSEDDFPTVGFVLTQAQRLGYELLFLPGGERLADPDTWAPAFHDDVQLVLATGVYSNSSIMPPCAEIARRARERGVFSVLDIAQAAGSVPIHLNEWAPDFAVGTSLKYLCGGAGAAFLWAQKDTAERAAPMDVGWFSHQEPFEFDIHHFEYAPGAARYTGGTPSIAPFAGAIAGHEVLNTHGVDKIYAHNQALLSRLFSALPANVFQSTTVEGARGSGVLIKVRNLVEVAADLKDAGIGHDSRLGVVRVSIHLYNDEEDIDTLVASISPHLEG